MNTKKTSLLSYRPCVGITLINRENKIFAGKRIDNNTNAWQMPQGGIDNPEDPLTAAFRELEEETGVTKKSVTHLDTMDEWIPYDLPLELVPKLWNGKFRGQIQKWFLFKFEDKDTAINIQTNHPEFAEWQWMAPNELIESIVPFKLITYTKVLRYFKKHLEN